MVAVPAEGLSFICSIPGHADAGMTGTISVKGEAAGGDSHGGPAPATDVQPDANAPKYAVHDPKAPALLAGDTHDIDLVIEEKLMTVAEGFSQAVWTFGGSVPGPVIRVKQGDLDPDPPRRTRPRASSPTASTSTAPWWRGTTR